MAADIDIAFLHSLALDAEDTRVLDRIAADRRTLLAGGTLPEPGRPLQLKLDIDPCLRPSSRGPADPLILTLRSDLAPASLDTLIELFRDGVHTRVAGFREIDAGPRASGAARATGTGTTPPAPAPATLIDLGANEGFYTLLMKRCNPQLRVIAVEPVAENAALLRRNVSENGVTGVTVIEAAVTAQSGEIEIETYPHVGSVASTDLQAFPRPWIHADRIRRRAVPSRTFAELFRAHNLEAADIVKMDVEGSEEEIITGNLETLRACRRIVVECHGTAVRERCTAALRSLGYRIILEEAKRSGDVYAVSSAG